MIAATVAGCGGAEPESDRKQVVAAFYPLAFAAEQIAGDAVEVTNLTPPGVEPHDLEISAGDVHTLREADLVLYLGGGFQPAVERAVIGRPSAVDLLDTRPEVDPERVGLAGFSAGASIALVAAADPRIAADVDHVVSFGGYYDALDTFGAIATHHIEYNGIDEEWTPRRHAEKIMALQLINAVDDAGDRELLYQLFVERKPKTEAELATLGPVARNSYEFLANRDPSVVRDLIDRLPRDEVAKLDYLSPRTSIEDVKADLFIIHDRADPFIPYTESRRLEDAIGRREGAHFDEIRLFEHVEPKLTQRPEIIALDSARLLFRLYQLLLRWD